MMKDIDYNDDNNNKSNPPPDKHHLVNIIFLLGGLGGLIPWNFFINSFGYFLQKMSYGNNSFTESPEQLAFKTYFPLSSLLPFAIMNIFNLALVRYFSVLKIFFFGGIFIIVFLIVSIIFIYIELSAKSFLIITFICTVFLNLNVALLQSSSFGICARLPPINIKFILEGQAIAGVLASACQILAVSTTKDLYMCTMVFFVIGLVFVVCTLISFMLLLKLPHFKYYWNNKTKVIISSDKKNDEQPSLLTIASDLLFGMTKSMKEVIIPGLCVIVTMATTLSVFPSVTESIRSQNYLKGDTWTDKYYKLVTVYLSFNVYDWFGRFMAGLLKWPNRNQFKIVIGLVLIRIIIIPYFMYCNTFPRGNIPVYLTHDAFPIIGIMILGFTGGYLTTIGMMYGTSFASPGNEENAGIALSIYLALGLSLGVSIAAGLVSFLAP